MNKVYYIMIKGKKLESRNLKELLARAVAQKKNSDRAFMIQNLSRGQTAGKNATGSCLAVNRAAAI
jgi:hypothetical protein